MIVTTWLVILLVFLLACVVIWWRLKPVALASKSIRWSAIHQRTPQIKINADSISIKGIRNFSYDKHGRIVDANYFDDRYVVSQVQQVWSCFTHFAKPGLAHILLSFEFSDGRYLVVSVEARCKSQQRYHPIKGLFFAYPKLFVFGTEADLIGLRYLHLKHDTFLYPLQLSPSQSQQLFLSLAQEARQQQHRLSYYHSVFNNCLTSVAQYAHLWHWSRSLWDYRILLPGFADRLAYKIGLIGTEQPFKQLKQQAHVKQGQIQQINEDFSQQLRQKYR